MKKIIFFWLMLGAGMGPLKMAGCQSLEQQLLEPRVNCQDLFGNAMDILPGLQQKASYDSITWVVNYLEKKCGRTQELFNLELLQAIELDYFREADFFDSTSFFNLENAAANYARSKQYPAPADSAQVKYYQFTSGWAKRLLSTHPLDATEELICQVLAGLVRYPGKEINAHSDKYSYLFGLSRHLQKKKMSEPHFVGALSAGYWQPTGDLRILGGHPSLGLQLGYCKLKSEFDLTVQFRFLRSANDYTVERSGQKLQLHHFFGGYAGFDYSYYFIQKLFNALGLLAGVGYDSFDIASDDDDDNLKPISIGTINLNLGTRYNHYFKNGGYIGLVARYNSLFYRNPGGSSLSGNAFSFDLVFGRR